MEPREDARLPRSLGNLYQGAIKALVEAHHNRPEDNLGKMLTGLTAVRNMCGNDIDK
ncbi:hypothetical protein [Endozoicomonas ascidiicola]|uniref:hypothetical protein n=1 Tax=Endozoicomonas ascidiicola TaxID=1698521 RepID=UPI0012FB3AB0|nr:hypothetical protein [Endozoicomonas ascidiicola]